MILRNLIHLAVLTATLGLGACGDGGSSGAGATKSPASGAAATKAPTESAPVAEAPTEASAGNMYETAAKGTGFSVGNMMAVRLVYVFFDPQCPHCGHLWEAAQPLANQVRMVWIPVGFISAKSAPQGAALLASSDPAAAMTAHEKSLLARQGGLIPPDNQPAELLEKVKANTKIWQQLGGESVPMMVFKNPASGEPGKFAGAMDTASLKKLLGV